MMFRKIIFFMGYVLGLCALNATADQINALVIGPSLLRAEFVQCLEHYGATVNEIDDVSDLSRKNLDPCQILVLCAPMSPIPVTLSRRQSDLLLNFIENGGRAYLEYVRLDTSVFSQWTIQDAPVLNRFENLAVVEDNAAASGLLKDDLLEEHNAWLLNVNPPEQARVLLNYGLYLGTYQVAYDIKDMPTYFTVTVDLGATYSLQQAEQDFGGLNPDYAADLLRVSLAGDDKIFHSIGEQTSDAFENGLTAKIDLAGQGARYVRFYAEKEKSGPLSDFIVLNGVRVFDSAGCNVALNRPYEFQIKDGRDEAEDSGKLTNGEPAKQWREDRSHLYSAPKRMGFNKKKWNGLVQWDHGRGTLFYAATSFSTFRRNHYRLTRRWEALVRGLSLSLFPVDRQSQFAMRWVPLEVWTWPRRWSVPGQHVQYHVKTDPAAKLTVVGEGLELGKPLQLEPGHYQFTFTPQQGSYAIDAEVKTDQGGNKAQASLKVCSREQMYREALDLNMQWFLRSGIMPADDASSGVLSTLEVGALYAGCTEDLPSAFRADCQCMSGKAFYLYGDLCDQQAWCDRAEQLARWVMKFQFTDPSEPSFGAYRWLLEGNDAIYPQDDNNRISEYLAWMYDRTGQDDYLRAALRSVEFSRDTSREDWTLTYWVTTPEEINEKGRAYMRSVFPFRNVTEWCLLRHHYAYRSTGSEDYLDALRALIRIYGELTLAPDRLNMIEGRWVSEMLHERGLAMAIAYLPQEDPLRKNLMIYQEKMCSDYLEQADVKRYGAPVQEHEMSGVEIGYIYNNDCSIHTHKGEALTDQLYTTSIRALQRWEAYKSNPSPVTRDILESSLDYLVRIQMWDEDPRLDGCWLRSFDMEHWEYYGTRYDPNYGAYHAYSGWMNSVISQALAYYLLDENPFEPQGHGTRPQALAIMQQVRGESRPEYLREVNRLKGVLLEASIDPDLGCKNTACMTDGQIEGIYSDGLSSGWTVVAGEDDFTLELSGKLNKPSPCERLSLRLGGLHRRYQADRIEFYAGSDHDHMQLILSQRPVALDGGNWFMFPKTEFDCFTLKIYKKRNPESDEALYVGEVQLMQLLP